MKNIMLLCLGSSILLPELAVARDHYFGRKPGHKRVLDFFWENSGSWKEGDNKQYKWFTWRNEDFVQHDWTHVRIGAHNPGATGHGVYLKAYDAVGKTRLNNNKLVNAPKYRYSAGKYAFNFQLWNYSIPMKVGVGHISDHRDTWAALWLEGRPPGTYGDNLKGQDRVEIDLFEHANVRHHGGDLFSAEFNVYTGTGATRPETVTNRTKLKYSYKYHRNQWRWTDCTIRFGSQPDYRVTTNFHGVKIDTGWKPNLNWRNKGVDPNKADYMHILVQNRPFGYGKYRNRWKVLSTLEFSRIVTPD